MPTKDLPRTCRFFSDLGSLPADPEVTTHILEGEFDLLCLLCQRRYGDGRVQDCIPLDNVYICCTNCGFETPLTGIERCPQCGSSEHFQTAYNGR